MIEIKTATGTLDLEPGDKIRIGGESPIFDADNIKQEFSYPVQAPWTPNNARQLGHPEYTLNATEPREIPCQLFIDGLFFRAGVINYRGFQGGLYDIDLTLAPNDTLSQIKDRALKEFDYGGPYLFRQVLETAADFSDRFDTTNGPIDTTNFVWAPVRNTDMFDGGNIFGYDDVDPDFAEHWGMVNHFDPSRSEAWVYTDSAHDYWVNTFTPFPYLVYVVNHVFEQFGQTVNSDVFNQSEVERMVMVNNTNIAIIYEYDVSGPAANGYYGQLQGQNGNGIYLQDAMPDMTIIQFMIALGKRFCSRFFFNSDNTVDFLSIKGIIQNNDIWNITDLVEHEDDHRNEYEPVDGFTIAGEDEPLENFKAEEFDTSELWDTVDGPTDLAALTPAGGELVFVTNVNAYYKYKQTGNAFGWVKIKDNIEPIDYNGGGDDIDVGVALTRMTSEPDVLNSGRSWLLPTLEMKMHDNREDWHGLGLNRPETLRLLFYRGDQEDSNGDDYPLLTNGTKDYDGNDITHAVMTETLDGDNGIINTWYQEYLSMLLNAKPVTVYARLQMHHILAIKWQRKVRIKQHIYLIKSYDFEASTDGAGVKLTKLVLMPV